MPQRASWRALLHNEDWWAVWLATVLLVAVLVSGVVTPPKAGSWTNDPLMALPSVSALMLLFVGLGSVTAVAVAALRGSVRRYLTGFPVVFLLALVAQIIGSQKTVNGYGLEYVIWGLLLGLAISNLTRVPAAMLAAARTELFIKTGLVLLGAEILFSKILTVGGRGLGVGWLVPPIVFTFMYFFGTRTLAIARKPLVATIAAETSVCGVSAAIAVGTATRATREEISYAISICLLFTVAMMAMMPALAMVLGLSHAVAGAWIGGTVDSTGAVIASGAMLGEQAMEVAAVVKMIQNILIGVIAFVVAVLWVTRVEPQAQAVQPSLAEVWDRFPKFILGFAAASVIFSAVLTPTLGQAAVDGVLKVTKELRAWLFAMAFVSIGLESNFRDLAQVSRDSRPIVLYVVGQSANIVLSLIAAWVFFG